MPNTPSPQPPAPIPHHWSSLLALLLLLPAIAPAQQDITVQATVDRTRVSLGESLTLSIVIQGVQNVDAPGLEIDGFESRYMGPSSQISVVNGQMTARITHRYRLFPKREGRFRLGPFSLEVGGERYESAPLTVEVSDRPAPGSDAAEGELPEKPFLVIEPGEKSPYVGESVPVAVKLYVGDTPVEQVQYPEIEADGFTMGSFGQPQRYQDRRGGRRFTVLHFSTVIRPVRPGPLRIGPAVADMMERVPRRRGFGRRGFFNDLFAETRPYQARSDVVTLDVRPLPEEGRPESFTGAVGTFDLEVEVSPRQVQAGDPITVRTRIQGSGNLATLEAPRVAVGEAFRAYDPQPDPDASGQTARVFEQVLIPRDETVEAVPAVELSYFDPERERYVQLSRGPFPIEVKHAAAGAAPVVMVPDEEGKGTRRIEKLGRDIVFIKEQAGAWRERRAPSGVGAGFVFLLLLPVAGYAALLFESRRRERLSADPRRVRFRQAGREARRRLDAMREQGGGYDELAAIVRDYLAARLDLPRGAIDAGRVGERLAGAAEQGDVRHDVAELFGRVERSRYAPGGAGDGGVEDARALAERIVARLESDRGLERRILGGALVVLLALGAALPLKAQPQASERAARTGAESQTQAFFAGNEAYREGRYQEAIASYRSILEQGRDSAALYFNLGNAYFRSGETGEAILNYERARRLAPRDPDVRANLGFARDHADLPEPQRPRWHRLLFPFAERLTAAELKMISLVVWWLLWAILFAHQLLPSSPRALGSSVPRSLGPWNPRTLSRYRDWLRRAAWVGAVVFVVVGASLLARLQRYEGARTVVVTAQGETPVRFAPAETGTEHYRATEGSLAHVTGKQNGWMQIRRTDGLRGWIQTEAVTLLWPDRPQAVGRRP